MEYMLAKNEAAKSSAPKGLAFAHTGNIGGAAVLLITGIILLLPSGMSLSRSFHPFIVSGGAPKKRKNSAPERKQKDQSKEVHSIFEDWPDPVPFPVTTLYTFSSTSPSELSFTKGQHLIVLDCRGNWWQAKDLNTNTIGFVPSNFVQVLQKAKVIKRYLAASDDEASIQEGQTVELMEHHEFLSLVRTVEGKIGSVPTSCLEVIPDPSLEKLKA